MKLSARNQVPATIKKVIPGQVNSEVIMDLGNGVELAAMITRSSAENMGLQEGMKALAVVKASNVMIALE